MQEEKPNQPTPTSPGVGIGIPPVTVNLNVPTSPPAQPPVAPTSYKAVVITDTCAICLGLKEYLQKKGLTDKVKIINASTPEGRKFADEHGIKMVPECMVIDEAGKQVRVCTKEEFEKVLTNGA